MNLVAKLLDDGVYGGLIQIDLDDIDDLLRRFNVQEHVIAKWNATTSARSSTTSPRRPTAAP